MRRTLLAVLLTALVMVAPAYAQATAERVLVDATVWVNPAIGQALCMTLNPGQITVAVRRASGAVHQRPTEFQFYGLRADQEAGLKVTVEGQETTGTTRVKGVGHYCWQITVYAPEIQNMTIFEQGEYVQTVDVRITHRPD